ncbi:MAG: hypothetical protein A3B91_05080 [Candidatus Yanofskybacteria bacterium RIFCSPHIGHO2_02_FULL_41_29]|uniref:Uncharacterized protein n=1 Tax=Candidatus Yanofskybacteria bacterium RIFCSPHIGHO2_01_FULL_41_53 TaxID=1802663 RepID=A0A1F8EIL2_9BACT|nr:MAG: hypothetical protein A2650_04080 [Candidatus Yanofskybacteria bacterium RIFCSPHIGHO2_01_FULL_41_53]OGN11667.1 MAG: hypothetical protein A3B91_05080 [Candidatus Yanofskybacteria bacterium RIFCSPHIGHO2_02_FULL_41_29]OGN17900.1 MAG: hypothetical protein A3F48_01990 [Candidatus Yanofskybacteria bacterium RIFCSPHIGHO2_12_FULL_41_9]OGN23427.1 MAG: hypothetical protein A2916_03470 [Candidatus Yanofskybacteria bacterium RIFCSPLOWO2_01_FULL_41_67]OGN30305.1 MAG: hypothetical protein A3H54_04460 
MEKSKIQRIESQKPDELWGKLTDPGSEENVARVFESVFEKITVNPNLYYVEGGPDNTFATVRRRGDNNLIYETSNEIEIEALLKYGAEK